MSKTSYPGEGHAWADFLHHRARTIDWLFLGEGDPSCKGDHAAIARTLSMTPRQVEMIYMRDRKLDHAWPSTHTNTEGNMTRIESVIGKMRSWLADDEAKVPSGCARVLAFPESDVKALLEHIEGLSAPQEKVQGLGGKITNVDLAKEAEKLKT